MCGHTSQSLKNTHRVRRPRSPPPPPPPPPPLPPPPPPRRRCSRLGPALLVHPATRPILAGCLAVAVATTSGVAAAGRRRRMSRCRAAGRAVARGSGGAWRRRKREGGGFRWFGGFGGGRVCFCFLNRGGRALARGGGACTDREIKNARPDWCCFRHERHLRKRNCARAAWPRLQAVSSAAVPVLAKGSPVPDSAPTPGS